MSQLDKNTDESLMLRIKSGDQQAFSELVKRHTERFYALAYRTCGDQNIAEDIVQEAFLKLWRKPQSWKDGKGAKFTTWFYRVVINQAYDFGRKKKAEYGTEHLERFADDKDGAYKMLERSQEQQRLEYAIQALPDRQKAALNLCFYEGFSNKEAAQIMGVGVKALESLLMRAKKALKSDLVRAGVIEGSNAQEKAYG